MANSRYPGIFNELSVHYIHAIEETIKQLLQNKHLYQSQEIILPSVSSLFNGQTKKTIAGHNTAITINVVNVFDQGKEILWHIEDNYLSAGVYSPNQEPQAYVKFTPPTVRLYCTHCDCLQPYNYMNGSDVLGEYLWDEERERREAAQTPRVITPEEKQVPETKARKVEQVFQLIYQCQGCKSLPEVFLIRRTNMKLTLCGRTPMEKVVVPPYIPKRQRDFFSGAIIAFQAGQMLPGIFMLRTFLEQYVRARSATPLSTNIEALFDEYQATLPKSFKDEFPSLRSIYERLSADIHAAAGSPEVFNQAREEIERHFDAKRLFRISE